MPPTLNESKAALEVARIFVAYFCARRAVGQSVAYFSGLAVWQAPNNSYLKPILAQLYTDTHTLTNSHT